MKEKEFKKYRLRIILLNSFFYIFMLGLLILAIYDKRISDILFSETFLPESVKLFFNILLDRLYADSENEFTFVYVFGLLAVPLIFLNFWYFEEKRKYNEAAGIKEKDDGKLKKVIFSLFTVITIINLLLLLFLVGEVFWRILGISLPEDIIVYTFLALIPNISIAIAAKVL